MYPFTLIIYIYSVDGDYVDQSGYPLTKGGGTLVLGAHDSIIGPGGQELLSDLDGTILIYRTLSKILSTNTYFLCKDFGLLTAPFFS